MVTELSLSVGDASGNLRAVPHLLPGVFVASLSFGLHENTVYPVNLQLSRAEL